MRRFALVVLMTYCLSHVGLGAPITASEGQTVVLPCNLKPLGSSTLIWRHRNTNALKVSGGQILDRAHDRVSPFWDELSTGNLSIQISDVQLSDSGEYECHLLPDGFQSNTRLSVSERKMDEGGMDEKEMEERDTSTVRPGGAAVVPRLSAGDERMAPLFGLAAPITASEGQTVVLPCNLKPLGSSTLIWRHRNTNALKVSGGQILDRAHDRVSPFWDELSTGNLSIQISDVQLSDSGEYECHLLPDGFQSNTRLSVIERKMEEKEMEDERDTSTVRPGGAAVVPRLSACGLMLILCYLFL